MSSVPPWPQPAQGGPDVVRHGLHVIQTVGHENEVPLRRQHGLGGQGDRSQLGGAGKPGQGCSQVELEIRVGLEGRIVTRMLVQGRQHAEDELTGGRADVQHPEALGAAASNRLGEKPAHGYVLTAPAEEGGKALRVPVGRSC